MLLLEVIPLMFHSEFWICLKTYIEPCSTKIKTKSVLPLGRGPILKAAPKPQTFIFDSNKIMNKYNLSLCFSAFLTYYCKNQASTKGIEQQWSNVLGPTLSSPTMAQVSHRTLIFHTLSSSI
uniref:Uncharacterized protein n=1 Tax=Lepeophtheirus salmonis TaxID=72036 RepID=A0A0K2VCP0_LEPSM